MPGLRRRGAGERREPDRVLGGLFALRADRHLRRQCLAARRAVLTFSPATRILIARDDVSFRGGIDHLAAVCRRVMADYPWLVDDEFVIANRDEWLA